jgi:hypothetical protein
MAGKILTRKEYIEAIETHFHEAKRLAEVRLMELELEEFLPLALGRWDRAAPEYGPCDLTARDQGAEATDELIDLPAWLIILLERRARGL